MLLPRNDGIGLVRVVELALLLITPYQPISATEYRLDVVLDGLLLIIWLCWCYLETKPPIMIKGQCGKRYIGSSGAI